MAKHGKSKLRSYLIFRSTSARQWTRYIYHYQPQTSFIELNIH